MSTDRAGIPPPFQVARLVSSLWIPHAVAAAAELGVADGLAGGPRPAERLAAEAGARPEPLRRLLRALATLELVVEHEDGRFALTPLGACLRRDAPESVHHWARLWGGPLVWPRWGHLVDVIRTGRTAPDLLDGVDTFEDMEAHPEERAVFDASMAELTRHLGAAVAAAYDFSGLETLVDVGGGHGALLPPLVKAAPGLEAVAFDLPHCRSGAERLLEAAGVADRCRFEAGDFFEAVPPGADAYVLKSVIHDWDDEHSVRILRICRAAMRSDARLLLLEIPRPERASPSPFHQSIFGTDLNMLVITGGAERTEAEYRELLARAGLELTRVVPTPATFAVLEARRAKPA